MNKLLGVSFRQAVSNFHLGIMGKGTVLFSKFQEEQIFVCKLRVDLRLILKKAEIHKHRSVAISILPARRKEKIQLFAV